MAHDNKSLWAEAKSDQFILTPMINDWLMAHGNDPVDSEIMDRVVRELTSAGRERSGSFSASSAGRCKRQQEFSFLGMPSGSVVYPTLQHTFHLGTWVGMQWAAMLLQAKLIEDIEVPLPWPKYRSMGSADGRGYVWWETVNPAWRNREFIWENKTLGSRVWDTVIDSGRPKPDHIAQIHRYMLVSGIDLAVVTYVNKGNHTNEAWHEFVVEADPELLQESKEELVEMNKAIDTHTLHDLLPQCKLGMGPVYKNCAFGGKNGICKTTKKWPA